MNDIHLERHVVVHEVCKRFLIRNNAADLRCREENILRLFLCKERLYSFLSCKVKFLVGSRDDVGITLSFELTHDRGAHHAAVACNVNLRVFGHRGLFGSVFYWYFCHFTAFFLCVLHALRLKPRCAAPSLFLQELCHVLP